MTEDLKNLAKHVKARRAEMDWTQLDVGSQGGPSNTTLTQVEAAKPPAPTRATRDKLDKGLRWKPGSAKAVLAGGDPVPLDSDDVGAVVQDPGYVSAPGDRQPGGATLDDVLAAIERMEADIEELKRRS